MLVEIAVVLIVPSRPLDSRSRWQSGNGTWCNAELRYCRADRDRCGQVGEADIGKMTWYLWHVTDGKMARQFDQERAKMGA